ncbi:conserved protein of unknown function [Ectopseudomonas oleovorans]|uniref:Uncharacterized protein n=1 Tax=Ectopseudomonas oleovorans TaxID=301 RepID=A0A653B9X5_ECTOL|nr:conserved protein of unknown function [Pseudomonas oleovorans]
MVRKPLPSRNRSNNTNEACVCRVGGSDMGNPGLSDGVMLACRAGGAPVVIGGDERCVVWVKSGSCGHFASGSRSGRGAARVDAMVGDDGVDCQEAVAAEAPPTVARVAGL